MNRKLVNGLLLLSVATVGCGVFTSCKDTDEDFKNQILVTQSDNMDKLRAELIALIDAHKQCGCPDDAQTLLSSIRDFLANPKAEGSMNSAVWSLIEGYLQSEIPGFQEWYKTNVTNAGSSIVTTSSLESLLGDYVKSGDIDLTGYVARTDADYVEMGQNLAALIEWKAEAEANMETISDEAQAAMDKAVEAYTLALQANTIIETLIPQLTQQLTTMSQAITELQTAVNALNEAMASLQEELAKLQPQIDAIKEQLNKLITSILIQQTYNPMFGTINLPIGLQSNINANYYGYTANAVEFPFGAPEYNGNSSVLNNSAVQAAIESLGYAKETVSGYYMADDNNANLGNIYLTINPNTVDFSGVKLSIVNSKDELCPVDELKAEKENDKVLDFGLDLTRSAENNGFYRVPVNVKVENATKLNIEIESGLKSSMKDALNNRTKSDLAEFGKVMLNQMNGFLPAYGVKSSWTTTDENGVETEHSVYSNYNLAVATVRPLGYQFLYDTEINRELPTFGRLSDTLHEFFEDIKNDITFSFGLGINEEDYQIDLDLSSVEFKIDGVEIRVDIPALDITAPDGTTMQTQPTFIILGYDPDGGKIEDPNSNTLKLFVESIQDAVNKMISDPNNPESLQRIIQDEVTGKINDLIADLNGQLKDMDGEVEKQVKDIIDNIENQLAGKLDRVDNLLEKYNNLADRINKFIKHANDYLQLLMAYSDGNGSLRTLSTTLSDPSRFVQKSGNAIELFATSYTAELVAPSYKKFVAITRAFNGTTPVSINAKEVSENAGLNQVLPGRQQRVAVKTDGLTKGLTYEIVYTSLDYRGYASTNLYYLTVK